MFLHHPKKKRKIRLVKSKTQKKLNKISEKSLRSKLSYNNIAKSLNKLKEKKEWKWEKEHQEAFDKLKEKITSQSVLALLRREGKF